MSRIPSSQNAKKATYQYQNGLRRSLKRLETGFLFYNVKLKDERLVKLLLCLCHDRKLHLPTYVEELLISALEKSSKSYREYFENDVLDVEIQTQSALRFFEPKRMATMDERGKGHTATTGFDK